MFFKGSRYLTVPDYKINLPDGRSVLYKATRFIQPTRPQVGHIISSGERLDHIAYIYYHDPERFWRICDANFAMDPGDLEADAGRKILIPASEDKV